MRIYVSIILAFHLLISPFSCKKPTPETDIDFLAKYGWTVTEEVKKQRMTIPESFEHLPGEFPIQIYWAANNELSKAIGFDIEPYLGKEVTAALYTLKETIPELKKFSEKLRGVIIRYQDNIIGAWIDIGRHDGFARALDRRSFAEIGVPEIRARNLKGPEWGDWLVKSGIVNPENEIEKKLSEMTPEQIIETYYSAIDDKDYTLAYACLTRGRLKSYLFNNMDNSQFFNSSFSNNAYNDIENIQSVGKNVSIKPYKPGDSVFRLSGEKVFIVGIDVIYKKEIIEKSGHRSKFFVMLKEVEQLGWRIHQINTGM